MKLLKAQPANRMTTEPPPPEWGKRKGGIVVLDNVELEFRVEDGDLDAFLDHHSCSSRRRSGRFAGASLYGYVILFAIFGLVFWVFGETAVAIAFLVLGPIVGGLVADAGALVRPRAGRARSTGPGPKPAARTARTSSGWKTPACSMPRRAPTRARPTPASSAA